MHLKYLAGSEHIKADMLSGVFYLCVGSTATSDNIEDLSQYDPGC